MKIVLLSGASGDIRLRRCARYLVSKGHDVIEVFGWGSYEGTLPFANTDRTDGCPAYVAHGASAYDIQRSILKAFEPELVWCFGLDAAWCYLAGLGYTGEVKASLDDGATIRESGWAAERGPIPVVYDAPEYERDRPWRWRRERTIEDWVEKERLVIASADRVVVVSEPIEAYVSIDHRLTGKGRTAVVYNAPLRPSRAPDPRLASAQRKANRKRIVFAGNTTPDRALDLLAFAFQRLQKKREVRLSHFGEITDAEIGARLRSVGATLHGPSPYPWPDARGRTLLDDLAACDVAYSGAWIEHETWRLGAPNKMFEYAFAGVPQVAPAGMVVFETMLREHPEIGGVFKPESLTDLVRAIVEKLERPMPEDARRAFVERWCFEASSGPAIDAVIETLRGGKR